MTPKGEIISFVANSDKVYSSSEIEFRRMTNTLSTLGTLRTISQYAPYDNEEPSAITRSGDKQLSQIYKYGQILERRRVYFSSQIAANRVFKNGLD